METMKKAIIIAIVCCIIIITGFILMLYQESEYTEKSENNTIHTIKIYNFTNNNIEMSYLYEGAESPYSRASVNISGKSATISIIYCCFSEEKIVTRNLSNDFLASLMNKYFEIDFFNLTINSYFVYDIGRTTISFACENVSRTISYEATDNEEIGMLVSMYWKIISQEDYLFKLKDYKNQDNGTVVNMLSMLKSDIGNNRTLDSNEFVPIFKDILLDKEHRDVFGGWVISCLAEIRGEYSSGDYNEWLSWIDENY